MFFNKKYSKYITEGTAFELGGVQYPANWLNLSTSEEKEEAGLVEVKCINEPKDDRFYWVSLELTGDTSKYINTPKQLEDSEVQDESGTVTKTVGLKTTWSNQIKQQVYTMLQPTDYIDIRNLREPEYKQDWMLWRDSVRAYSSTTVSAINTCTTVDALKSVIDGITWPVSPDAPVVEEPKVTK